MTMRLTQVDKGWIRVSRPTEEKWKDGFLATFEGGEFTIYAQTVVELIDQLKSMQIDRELICVEKERPRALTEEEAEQILTAFSRQDIPPFLEGCR
jgi:hypothetical protein